MSGSFHFDSVDLFTIGTLGPLGQRVFYLQCRAGVELLSLKFEKHQAAALAEYLERVLAQLPPDHAGELPDPDLDLREPVIEAFTIGALGIAYDETVDRIMVVAEEYIPSSDSPEDDLDDKTAASVRFSLTKAQVKALVARTRAIVTAGRKPCKFCHLPLDPYSEGWCPCHN